MEAVTGGLIDEAFALDRVARFAGWNAAGAALIGWMIGFAVLSVIVLVIRWVWRGFAGKSSTPH